VQASHKNHKRNWLLQMICCYPFLHTFQVSLICSLVLCCMAPARAMETFRIGTGGKTGVYYPIGTLIALGLTQQAQEQGAPLYGLIGVAQNSAGSIENIKGVVAGDLEAGLVQADLASFAFNGKKPFNNDHSFSSIRAIASLYPEKFQIVVRKDAGISTFFDLKGKRISVDEQGSGTLSVMRIVLAAHGMSENDLLPLYLKPVFTQDRIKNGQLDGFVMMAGAPMEAVTQLSKTGVSLVPVEPTIAKNIASQYPYLSLGKIDEGIYEGISETPSLEVNALLVVNDTMPEERAYALAELLFKKTTAELLKNGHPQGASITLESALNGVSIPLHAGAKRYYKELGLLD